MTLYFHNYPRTANYSADVSGFSLINTFYTNSSGEIVSKVSGETKIGKYVKTISDPTEVKYKDDRDPYSVLMFKEDGASSFYQISLDGGTFSADISSGGRSPAAAKPCFCLGAYYHGAASAGEIYKITYAGVVSTVKTGLSFSPNQFVTDDETSIVGYLDGGTKYVYSSDSGATWAEADLGVPVYGVAKWLGSWRISFVADSRASLGTLAALGDTSFASSYKHANASAENIRCLVTLGARLWMLLRATGVFYSDAFSAGSITVAPSADNWSFNAISSFSLGDTTPATTLENIAVNQSKTALLANVRQKAPNPPYTVTTYQFTDTSAATNIGSNLGHSYSWARLYYDAQNGKYRQLSNYYPSATKESRVVEWNGSTWVDNTGLSFTPEGEDWYAEGSK